MTKKTPSCKQCDETMVEKEQGKGKDKIYECPNCGSETERTDAFLKTNQAHKDWYNVPGKLGKQRGKPKHDMDS